MTDQNVEPPESVPADVVDSLESCDDGQLREVVHYAQQLLDEHARHTEEIQPRDGEEIVRVDDQGGYTSVIVRRPDATGEAQGPFAYRVEWEPAIDGDGGRYYWHYLGRVSEESGGD